jgi:hypothetical protein
MGIYLLTYSNIRRLLLKKRYLVLDEGAETHKHKFVIRNIIDTLGEAAALQELERTGVIHSGYILQSVSANSIILSEDNCNYDKGDITSVTLEPRKIVRIIGKEDGMIPLLACINEKGFVKEVDDTTTIIDFETNTIPSVQRYSYQIFQSYSFQMKSTLQEECLSRCTDFID